MNTLLATIEAWIDGRIDDQLFAFVLEVNTPDVVAPVQLHPLVASSC